MKIELDNDEARLLYASFSKKRRNTSAMRIRPEVAERLCKLAARFARSIPETWRW